MEVKLLERAIVRNGRWTFGAISTVGMEACVSTVGMEACVASVAANVVAARVGNIAGARPKIEKNVEP